MHRTVFVSSRENERMVIIVEVIYGGSSYREEKERCKDILIKIYAGSSVTRWLDYFSILGHL